MFSLAILWGCKKDDPDENPIETGMIPVSGVVQSDFDTEGLTVLSMYGEDEIENGSFTVDVAEGDVPQMLFVTNDTGGVVMMYRGLLNEKSNIVIDVESTVIGLITMNPMTISFHGSDFSQLADRIKHTNAYQNLYNAVERSIQMGADIFSPTNGALVNAITDMQQELFGFFDDVWSLIQLNQFNEFLGQNCGKLDVRAEGTEVLVRNLKCAPTYCGTLRSPSNNVTDINFPTSDRSPMEEVIEHYIYNHGWTDYGPTKRYNLDEVGIYTFDVAWDNDQGVLDIVSELFVNLASAVMDVAKIPSDEIKDAIDRTKDMVDKLLEVSHNADQMTTLQNFWTVFRPEWTKWLDDELTFIEKIDKHINKKTLKLLKKSLKGYSFVEDGFNIAMRLYYMGMCPKHLFFQACLTESGTIVKPGGSDPDIPDVPEDAISGLFTVDENGKQVYFADGNLQYINGEWCFAEHQWDYLGAYSATAWDLFGWSADNSNNFGMSTSTSISDYSGSFVDWGTQIGDGDTWYTLSRDEWYYVLGARPSAASKKGVATVTIDGNAIHGLVLLPDAWTLPAGLTFTSGYGPWTLNQYTAAEWEQMEAAGAVFLPAAGGRDGSELGDVGAYGFYWSSTPNYVRYAYGIYFYDGYVFITDYSPRDDGHSVRLVQDY